MAKKDLETVNAEQVEELQQKAAAVVCSPNDDNRRASAILKQMRQTMSVEALQGKISTLQAQLKRARSV